MIELIDEWINPPISECYVIKAAEPHFFGQPISQGFKGSINTPPHMRGIAGPQLDTDTSQGMGKLGGLSGLGGWHLAFTASPPCVFVTGKCYGSSMPLKVFTNGHQVVSHGRTSGKP